MEPTHSTSYWQKAAATEVVDCDVAIVGGGVVGCSVAYWLRNISPASDVVLIERGELASGASGRNAGFLLQGFAADYLTDIEHMDRDDARMLWRATLQNRLLVEDLFDPDGIGFAPSGVCRAAADLEEAARLERSATLLVEDGIEAEYMDGDAVNRFLSSRRFQAGLVLGAGAVVDPVRLARRLAETSGATIVEHAPVRSISSELREGIELVTPRLRVHAEKAVLTLNAYLPLLLPEFSALVRPVRAQMLSTASHAPFLKIPVYSHGGHFYARQLADGRLLAGGARHLHREDEVGYSLETTDALQDDIETYLSTYFPTASGLRVENRWAGTMGFSPDGLPVWGRSDDMPDLIWVTGFTGHGLSLGLVAGKMVAETVAGATESALTRFFSVERLQKQDQRSTAGARDA